MSPGDEGGFQTYFPYNQSSRADEVLLLRSKRDPVALTIDLRRVIAAIDPNAAIGRTNAYEDVLARRLVTRKLSLLLVSLLRFYYPASALYRYISLFSQPTKKYKKLEADCQFPRDTDIMRRVCTCAT